MIIEPQKIVLTDYFKVEKKDLIFGQIKKFYSQGKRKGIPYDGFLVQFKDEKLNKDDLKPNPYIIPNNYLVINSHRIFLRELLNLMNTAHKNRMNEIKFLSMDNDENLMDIDW